MANYSFILLDADRTLFDFDRAEEEAILKTFEHFGWTADDKTVADYRACNHAVWAEYERGEITQPQLQLKRFAMLLAQYDLDADIEEINRVYVENLAKGAYLLPGAEELCRALSKEAKLYMVTNGVAYTQHERFSRSALVPYFEDVFISAEVGFQKPQKEYFDYVFSHIPGFSKEKALLVGDSIAADILGGIQAGMPTCWYNPGKIQPKEDLPIEYEIRELSELLPIVLEDKPIVPVRSEREVRELSRMADAIWHEHYDKMIGVDQVDYMVEKFQSPGAIVEQMESQGYEYYFLYDGTKRCGYVAAQETGDELFLSKIYVQKEFRGRKTAKNAVAFLEEKARQTGKKDVWLTVNRNNANSIAAYKAMGFVVREEKVADIGGGFVMDDYIMEKIV